MEPDEHLLRRSVADPAAFEPLVERHTQALYAYLARRLPALADDLLAEVWLAAYAGRATFDPDRGPARGWLFSIARNTVNNHLRRPAVLPLGYESAEDGTWEAVDARLDAQRAAPALRDALRSLPILERELLLMVALDGLSPTEAAAALDIPAGTARSRLHRARARLREQLDDPVPRVGATDRSAAPTLSPILIPGAIS